MLREIVVAIGVSVMVLGGVLPAHTDDKDKDDDGNKKGGHRAILNAMNSGNAQHGQLTNAITALSGGHQAIVDAVNGGTSSSDTAHTTLQGQHATQVTEHNAILNAVTAGSTGGSTEHATLQGEHATQNTAQDVAHTALSGKVDAVQATVDALSGGGGGTTDLRGVTQNWDKTLPANDPGGACPSNSSRFTCVMGGAAVRDNETGLVWEQSPAPTPHQWVFARFQCTARVTGGRKGWRLPSFAELASLIDPSNVDPSRQNPALPPGHPFSNVQSARYWSASTDAGFLTGAWGVNFLDVDVGTLLKTFTGPVWCVRGGMNADQY